MKKWLALLLAALMVCSCMTFAVAAEETEVAVDDVKIVPISDADAADGWNGGKANLNTEEFAQGTGSISNTISGVHSNKNVMQFYYTSPVALNATGMKTLVFDLYVSDKAAIPGGWAGQVELSSVSYGDDKNEMNYAISLAGLETGWNRIQIALADFVTVGDVDLTNIRWFRIYDDPWFSPLGVELFCK